MLWSLTHLYLVTILHRDFQIEGFQVKHVLFGYFPLSTHFMYDMKRTIVGKAPILGQGPRKNL